MNRISVVPQPLQTVVVVRKPVAKLSRSNTQSPPSQRRKVIQGSSDTAVVPNVTTNGNTGKEDHVGLGDKSSLYPPRSIHLAKGPQTTLERSLVKQYISLDTLIQKSPWRNVALLNSSTNSCAHRTSSEYFIITLNQCAQELTNARGEVALNRARDRHRNRMHKKSLAGLEDAILNENAKLMEGNSTSTIPAKGNTVYNKDARHRIDHQDETDLLSEEEMRDDDLDTISNDEMLFEDENMEKDSYEDYF